MARDIHDTLAQGFTGVIVQLEAATVKSHVRNIFNKLNVFSRTEAIATASRRGFVQL